MSATYEVIVQRAAVFADPLALFVETDPAALDVYEAQRATDIRSELERIASDVLTKEEIADLLTGLYRLTARIEKLESNDQLSSEA